jgi:hypothetical protein
MACLRGGDRSIELAVVALDIVDDLTMTSRTQGFLFMAAGFAVWIAALAILYGVQATGCEFNWHRVRLGPFTLLHAVLCGLFTAHMGALLWLLSRCRQKLIIAGDRLDAFLWRASGYLSLGAIAATLWIGMALPLPSVCT